MRISSHADQFSLSARLRRNRMRYLDGMIHASGRHDLLLADLGGTRSQQAIRLLFPNATVHKKRLAGLVKSFIVTGKGAA